MLGPGLGVCEAKAINCGSVVEQGVPHVPQPSGVYSLLGCCCIGRDQRNGAHAHHVFFF